MYNLHVKLSPALDSGVVLGTDQAAPAGASMVMVLTRGVRSASDKHRTASQAVSHCILSVAGSASWKGPQKPPLTWCAFKRISKLCTAFGTPWGFLSVTCPSTPRHDAIEFRTQGMMLLS